MNETFIWVLNQLSFPWMPPHKPPSALVDEWKVLRFLMSNHEFRLWVKLEFQIFIVNTMWVNVMISRPRVLEFCGCFPTYEGGTYFSFTFFFGKKQKRFAFSSHKFSMTQFSSSWFFVNTQKLPMLRGRWSGAAGLRSVTLPLRVLCKTRKQLEMKRKFEKCLRKLHAYTAWTTLVDVRVGSRESHETCGKSGKESWSEKKLKEKFVFIFKLRLYLLCAKEESLDGMRDITFFCLRFSYCSYNTNKTEKFHSRAEENISGVKEEKLTVFNISQSYMW